MNRKKMSIKLILYIYGIKLKFNDYKKVSRSWTARKHYKKKYKYERKVIITNMLKW